MSARSHSRRCSSCLIILLLRRGDAQHPDPSFEVLFSFLYPRSFEELGLACNPRLVIVVFQIGGEELVGILFYLLSGFVTPSWRTHIDFTGGSQPGLLEIKGIIKRGP